VRARIVTEFGAMVPYVSLVLSFAALVASVALFLAAAIVMRGVHEAHWLQNEMVAQLVGVFLTTFFGGAIVFAIDTLLDAGLHFAAAGGIVVGVLIVSSAACRIVLRVFKRMGKIDGASHLPPPAAA
jgi:hypothetical protein